MVDTPKKESADYAANGMQMRFIGALGAIGALILLSLIVLQWLLAGQQQAVHVINVASQQRTLSQQIVKTAYRLIGVGSTEARRAAYEELGNALSRFQSAHAGLQHGSDELDLPANNDTPTALLFATLEPDYQAIVGGAQTVLATIERPGELHQGVQRMTVHEAAFLAGMDEIVAQFESKAAQRVGYARWLGLLFGLLTLAALVLAARKIFQPVMAGVQKNLKQHEDREAEMDKIFGSSPTALFLVDATSLAIERGNLKAEILMGCSSDNFVGHPFSKYFDTRLEANKGLMQKIRTGTIFDELPVLLVDARHNAVDALASMRQVNYTGLRRYLIAVTDVTHARKS